MKGFALLERQIYTMADVDLHLGLHPGTARRWIDGYTRGGQSYEPVIRPHRTGIDAVTWGSSSRHSCSLDTDHGVYRSGACARRSSD